MPASKITRMLGLAGRIFQRPLHVQAGALCLREGETGPEVLLVSSLNTRRWIIPKGWPMSGRTLAGAALQEAWEEAGVRGQAEETAFGSYVYQKVRKPGLTIPCEVQVFRIAVTATEKRYPEAKRRKRKWVPVSKAAEMVDDVGLSVLLRAIA
jgi:8-oxo-dGTP pyrophosphatase MutT (NUDIX family)